MQALAIYFTYGLQCYMPIRILNDSYAIPAIEKGTCKGTPYLWDLIIRFGITVITCKFLLLSRVCLPPSPRSPIYLQVNSGKLDGPRRIKSLSRPVSPERPTSRNRSIRPITVRFGPRYYQSSGIHFRGIRCRCSILSESRLTSDRSGVTTGLAGCFNSR